MSAIIDTLRATLSAAPDSWQCRLALVEALVAEEQLTEAATVLENVQELPEDLESQVKAGRAYGLIDPESGFQVIDGILAATPSCAPAHRERADLCLRIGDLESARRHYYTATTLDPTLSDARMESQLALGSGATGTSAPPVPGPTSQSSDPASSLDDEAPSPSYPSPSEAPVMSLRDALGLKPLRVLVDPDSIPDLPALAYETPTPARSPVHIPEESYRSHLSSVELRPSFVETPVVYNYREPDDSIFVPRISDDGILVANPLREDGATFDALTESLKIQKKAQEEVLSKIEHREKIQALAAGIASVALLCFLMLLVVTAIPRPLPPQIIAAMPDRSQDEAVENERLRHPDLQKDPVPAPASAMAIDMVAAQAFSPIAAPTFDTQGVALGMDGNLDGFGTSVDFGETGGGETMFFGGRSRGERILFVLDDSRSMTPLMIELRNQELERTLKTLRNVQYHVLIFAGGLYFADTGWGIKGKNASGSAPTEFTSPNGDYSFIENSLFDFKLVGEPEDFPVPAWLSATPLNIRRSLKIVTEAKIFSGTDWDTALQVAHLMQPPPDVIFFMSDGRDRELDVRQIVRNNKGNGAPVINCVAMQIAEGIEEFSEIARRTGGSYTIVDKDGEPIDGFEYAKDPKKFEGRL